MNCSSWIIYYHFEVYNFHNYSFVQLAQWIFSTKLELKAKTFFPQKKKKKKKKKQKLSITVPFYFYFISFRIFFPWHIRFLKRFMIFIKKEEEDLWSIWNFHLSQIIIYVLTCTYLFIFFLKEQNIEKLVWKLKS